MNKLREIAAQQTPLTKALLTASIMLATILQALDTTIANVALPHMQGALSASQDQIAWVLTSYIVAAAILTPVTGFFSDKLGRKRLFMISVMGFTISSMLCGAATTLVEMVLFRLMQGIFGASLVPLSQAVLLDTNPPERHGQAMAIWGMGVMLGPILGPTLGGWLTDAYNWRWVFYINVPLGVLAFLGIGLFIPDTEKVKDRAFDIFGFVLLSVAIGALQMMLDRGETKDWFSSPEIVIEACLSGVAFYMFIVHMFTAKKPFFDMALFKDRNLNAGLVLIFVIGIVLLSTMALLPPYLQNLMNYPVQTAGVVLAPRGVGTMFAMMLVGRLVGRVDTRLLITFGILATSLSLWQMSLFTPDVSFATLIETGLLQGVGMGFVFTPLSAVSFGTLPTRYRTEGTALFSLMRNIGSSIGISIMTALLADNTQINHASLAAHINAYNHAFDWPGVSTYWNTHSTAGLMLIDQQINLQAQVIAYANDFLLMTFITLAALPLLVLLKKPKKIDKGPAHAVME